MISEMDIFGMFDNKKLTACLILLVLELFIDGKLIFFEVKSFF